MAQEGRNPEEWIQLGNKSQCRCYASISQDFWDKTSELSLLRGGTEIQARDQGEARECLGHKTSGGTRSQGDAVPGFCWQDPEGETLTQHAS